MPVSVLSMYQGFRFPTVFPARTRFFRFPTRHEACVASRNLNPRRTSMQQRQQAFSNESGQSLIEYMILVALVVLVCVGSTKLLGTKINSKFKELKEQIDSGIPVKLSP